MSIKLYDLSEEEKRIIIHKGTEMPGTGEYDNFFQQGTYLCKQCHSPLYRSADKFDAHCGWPAFDTALPGAVQWTTDADGYRTEITCRHCGGHLGHVFIGEKMTDSNTRHCVNSASLLFVPEIIEESPSDIAVFGGGCFWCMEAVFQKVKGVSEVQSGFAGGTVAYPTYEQVVKGKTGHAEVIRIFFDSSIVRFDQLLDVFFTLHNPTTLNQQGADIGTQYRSIVLYNSTNQKDSVEKKIIEINEKKIWDDPIVTQVVPLDKFRIAEGYHQDFYNQNPNKIYCKLTISPKLSKLRKEWKDLLVNGE